jgi:hypothetical protein
MYNTKLTWFLFKEEPSYVIGHGPKYDAETVFVQLTKDFVSQARPFYHGFLEFNDFPGSWKDQSIPDAILNLVGTYTLLNHCHESPAYIVNLFPDSYDYGSAYFYFDNLRFRADEIDRNMMVIETVSALIRYAQNMRNWLGFAYCSSSW